MSSEHGSKLADRDIAELARSKRLTLARPVMFVRPPYFVRRSVSPAPAPLTTDCRSSLRDEKADVDDYGRLLC